MSTLAQYRQEMLRREPSLGQVEAVASLTTTTVVVNRLAVGTVQSGKFIEKWIVRPDAAPATPGADRTRMVSGYTASTGTLTHAGTNYNDTTSASENVEIHEQEPYLLDLAIQSALKETQHRVTDTLPLNNAGRYWLSDFSWITGPAAIARIGRKADPTFTRNRYFENWDDYQSITAGALQPKYWTLAGTSATFARQSTYSRRGPYGLQIVSAGGNVATVSAVYKVIQSGVVADSIRSQVITGAAVTRSVTASSQRVRVTSEDAAGVVLSTSNSSFHAGGGTLSELSVEHTVHASAEQVRVQLRQEQNETAQAAELYGFVGTLNDTIRRDAFIPSWTEGYPEYEQGQPLLLYGPRSQSGALVIESYKGYAPFTQSRVDAGTADSDVSDAPLDTIAEGALFHLYAGLEPEWRDAKTTNASKARAHFQNWSALRAQHLAVREERGQGFNLPASRPMYVNSRIR